MKIRHVTLVTLMGVAIWLLTLPAGPAAQSPQKRGQLAETIDRLQSKPKPSDTNTLRLDGPRLQALVEAHKQGLDWIPGEVLVRFKDGLSPAETARVLSVLRESERTSAVRWVGEALLLSTPGEPDPESAATVLARQPEVIWAQPNYIRHTQATPDDPDYNKQWHFSVINLPAAWEINPGGSADVTIAVVDTGVTETTKTYNWRLWTGRLFETLATPYAVNPDIEASRITPGRDFVLFDDGTPVLDMDGHGTHVAGTILQTTGNGLGTAGIAYKSKLLPVKVCYSEWDGQVYWSGMGYTGFWEGGSGCPDDAIVDGIRYAADRGAKVINLSLGGAGESQAELEAVQYAVTKGAFVSMSAGNDYESGNKVNSPARYAQQIDGAMCVGAVSNARLRSYYSNTASGTEIAAPGGDVRLTGTAGLVYQMTIRADDYDWETVYRPRFDRYTTQGYQGTSMAAPHISGIAALLYSQGIRNPAAIEAAIKQFAVDLGDAGKDNEYGYGLVDTRAALRGLGVAR